MKKVPIIVDECPVCTGYMILNGGTIRKNRYSKERGENSLTNEGGMFALSRYKRGLMICPGCGVREAMIGWFWEHDTEGVVERAHAH